MTDDLARGASTPRAAFLPADQIRLLAAWADVERTAFQSVSVAVLQTLNRACYHERRAAETILSLAQHQKLQHLIDELEATRQTLDAMLSPHGALMLSRNTASPSGEALESSWWFALCEALHALGEGVARMRVLTAAQPRSSAAWVLSDTVGRLLKRHYNALFAEAEHWLG